MAYRRFLNEVRQELAHIHKEYNTEILKRQNNEESIALHRSLEWFKQECIKLSNEVKDKQQHIDGLKSKLEEMHVYKRGYEKGIKSIKKDMLVLKFINKTKTSIIRKYSDKLESAHKYIDATDLRHPLKLYLAQSHANNFQLLNDNIYVKNQMKHLVDQPGSLSTSDLCDFMVKFLRNKEVEYAYEMKKREERIKKQQAKLSSLCTSMGNHRSNITNMPVLINAILEDYILCISKEQSQEISINRALNTNNTKIGRTDSARNNENNVLITTSNLNNHVMSDEERYFIMDFNTDVYGRMDDDHKKELINKLMNNKIILFGFREYLLSRMSVGEGGRLDNGNDGRIRLKADLSMRDSIMDREKSKNNGMKTFSGFQFDNRSVSGTKEREETGSGRLNRSERGKSMGDSAGFPRVSKNDSFSFAGPASKKNTRNDPSRSQFDRLERDAIQSIGSGGSVKRNVLRQILKRAPAGPA